MSDTPRSDNEFRFKESISENPCQPNEHSEWMASVARQLERELADAKERIARMEAAGDVMAGRLSILAEFRRDEIMVKNWNISKTSLKEAKP